MKDLRAELPAERRDAKDAEVLKYMSVTTPIRIFQRFASSFKEYSFRDERYLSPL